MRSGKLHPDMANHGFAPSRSDDNRHISAQAGQAARQSSISVSLGMSATFLFGGHERAGATVKVPLHHGVVVVWGGVDRMRYHGVLPLKDRPHVLLGSQRINFTFRNPIAIIVPCHRVIASNGDLKGYAWGLHHKRWLLEHEKAIAANESESQTAMLPGFRS